MDGDRQLLFEDPFIFWLTRTPSFPACRSDRCRKGATSVTFLFGTLVVASFDSFAPFRVFFSSSGSVASDLDLSDVWKQRELTTRDRILGSGVEPLRMDRWRRGSARDGTGLDLSVTETASLGLDLCLGHLAVRGIRNRARLLSCRGSARDSSLDRTEES